MIDIKSKLQKSYNSVQIKAFLYDNMPWYKRPDILILAMGVCIFLATAIPHLGDGILFSVLLIANVIVLYIGFLFICHFAKKRLRAKGIKVDDSIFSHWWSDDYHTARLNEFYSQLKCEGLLQGNKSDLDALSGFIEYCRREASFLLIKDKIFMGSLWISVTASVAALVFKSFVREITVSLEIVKGAAMYLLLIALFVVVCNLIGRLYLNLLNKPSKKYEYMERLLNSLRLNLMITYASKKAADSNTDEEEKASPRLASGGQEG